ncbi:MAG: hypothetical protein OXF05_02715 [Hyphomicrobiales bacterium]|nr:hypothetical protein [Hyphomicrobiales bacterium]
MADYIVIFDRESDSNRQRIAKVDPNAYEHDPRIFFVRSDEVSQTVAVNLKIKGEGRDTAGAVFKISSAYSGYTSKSLWEWLGADE